MSRVLSDVRFILRSLFRSPLFTAVAVLSLAIGIGANSAIFSLLDQVMLRSLPVKDPQQLVSIAWKGPVSGMVFGPDMLSYPMYRGLRDKTQQVFSGVAARFGTSVDLGWQGVAERTNAELVSGNYFQVLGVSTVIGRPFSAAEDEVPGGAPYVVLSYGYWQKRFGGNPSVLNATVNVNSHPMTVVGIAAPGFRGTDSGTPADVFLPVVMKQIATPTWDHLEDRAAFWLQALARLRPGVTRQQAEAATKIVYRHEQREDLRVSRSGSPRFRREYLENKFWLEPAGKGFSSIREQFSTALVVLMCMVGTLLLIACGNLANLLIARASARQKEIAIRLSLGARPGAIIRLMLIESLLLSLTGGALALLVASWSGSLLLRALPSDTFSQVVSTHPDYRVFGFTLLLSVATAILFGLAPAIQAARPDLINTLKSESRSVVSGNLKLRKGMVAAQIALSLLLLIGAGLFTRSLYQLMQTASGLRTDHVLSFSVDPSLSGYSDNKARQVVNRLRAQLAAVPGVEAVSGAANGLLSDSDESRTTQVEGYTPKETEDMNPTTNRALPGLFSTLGIPLIAGREFSERDLLGTPKVAIVNQAFARQYFGNRSPLGRHVGYGSKQTAKYDLEIVGVIRNAKQMDLKKAAGKQVWTAELQEEQPGSVTFYLRTFADPRATAQLVRRSVRQVDAGLPLYDLKTLQTQINETHYVDRLISLLSAAFGIVATLLAAIGVYGVMAFTVARRTAELGIRMALGASQSSVLGMVMSEVVLLTAIGVGVALPVALALGRYLRSQLFEIQPNDPLTLAGATAVLIVVALIAGFIPARRATRIDPMVALRWE